MKDMAESRDPVDLVVMVHSLTKVVALAFRFCRIGFLAAITRNMKKPYREI